MLFKNVALFTIIHFELYENTNVQRETLRVEEIFRQDATKKLFITTLVIQAINGMASLHQRYLTVLKHIELQH